MPTEIRHKNCLSRLMSSSNFYKNSLLFNVLQERPIQRLISRATVWNTIELVNNFDPIMEWQISWEKQSVFNNEWIDDPTVKVNGFDLQNLSENYGSN